MTRSVVLGVDSGTQSTKVIALDLETGEEVAEARAPHSGADVQHPHDWWEALRHCIQSLTRHPVDVRGISVAGQQHGLVTLDSDHQPVRPAPLWNNVDAAPDAERLNQQADFASATGSRLVASITISKLAHLARIDPDDLARTAAVCLPHDYLSLRLTGNLTTDRGDASGCGWWSPASGETRRDLLALAIGESDAERLHLPTVLGPEQLAGTLTKEAAEELGLPAGIPVGPGSGDNPAAAVGIGATNQELVISLGTSGTAYAVSDHAVADQTGEVAGFADATGRFLPLACMINCTRVVDLVATSVGLERAEALDRVANIDPGASGLLMMPYFDGERTPNLPYATGTLLGLTSENTSPELLVRAALDGVAAGLAYCLDTLARLGVTAPRITLVGGGSRHLAWQQAIADAASLPVSVREGTEHVARGAAIQAAAIVRGETVAELSARWRPVVVAVVEPRPGMRHAFQLERRRQLINEYRQRAI